MKLWMTIIIPIALTACNTYPHSKGRSEYIRIIRENSAGDKKFSGVYENFEFHSTLFTHEVSRAIHDRLKQYYDWTAELAEEKLKERMADLDNKTKVWLSFYTPNNKDDNLSNKLSIWKIYLVNQGQRYEGRPYPANINLSEAQALMPYHSRWTTAYYVDFPVPTDQIKGPTDIIITGPLGRRKATFPNRDLDP